MPLDEATVVVATRTEARAFRSVAPGITVRHAGVALKGWKQEIPTPVVISAGLAGGLTAAVQPGVVVVPERIATGAGDPIECDAAWTEALISAAERVGCPVVREGIVTLPAMATGAQREEWAARGFVAADMESGLLALRAPRCAAVRVVLDTPARDLSARWRRPALAALDPRNWSDAIWLARHAPQLARRAAHVVRAAIEADSATVT